MTQATRFIHDNGLTHQAFNESSKSTQAKDFCAVFVVATPTLNNTGVAHAVEHMVFRRSNTFPAVETLFQLTALTDVKINASTYQDVTYFHCQGNNINTFNLGLKYLLSGLLQASFNEEDIQQEIFHQHYGVIYCELTMLTLDIQHQYKLAINNALPIAPYYDEYMGSKESVTQITQQHINAYYQQFYHASNITLLTQSVEINTVKNIINSLSHIKVRHRSVNNSQKRLTPILPSTHNTLSAHTKPNQEKNKTPNTSTNSYVIRLSISSDYISFIKQYITSFIDWLKKEKITVITPTFKLVSHKHFYLDIIKTDIVSSEKIAHQQVTADIKQYLCFFNKRYTEFLASTTKPPRDKTQEATFNKYPATVAQLIKNYQQNAEQTPSTALPRTFIIDNHQVTTVSINTKPTASSVSVDTNVAISKHHKPLTYDSNSNHIDNNPLFTELQALVNSPKGVLTSQRSQEHLPQLLSPLYINALTYLKQSTDTVHSITDDYHALLLIDIKALADIKALEHIKNKKPNSESNKTWQRLLMGKEKKVFIRYLLRTVCTLINAYPNFLASRCQGHCYTTKVLYQSTDNTFIFMSAFAVNPRQQLHDFNACLLLLITDHHYIENTITLALAKHIDIDQDTNKRYVEQIKLCENIVALLDLLQQTLSQHIT